MSHLILKYCDFLVRFCKMRKGRFIAFYLAILMFSLHLCSCDNTETVIGTIPGTEIELEYKYGEISIVYDDMSTDEIYTDLYNENIVSPLSSLSLGKDKVCYSFNTAIYTSDNSPYVLSLCADPVCDHTKMESCIVSYGLLRYPLYVGDDVFFVKGNGIYRYSSATLQTTPYAIFNAPITMTFVMGKYLYLYISNELYVRIDMVTRTARILHPPTKSVQAVYPSDGKIYCLDSGYNIYEYDCNLENATRLISSFKPSCFIQNSYQVYDNKIYYVSEDDGNPNLHIYDISQKKEEVFNNICCFGINNGAIYYLKYDPILGPEFDNNGVITRANAVSGNKLWCADIDSINTPIFVASIEDENMRLDNYFIHVTDKYVYMNVSIFTDLKIETWLFRLNRTTKEWQAISGENH